MINQRTNEAPVTSGVILAGGRSRRLGQDKRRLRLWGTAGPTLLEHTIHVTTPLCAEVLVVLNDASAWPDLPARLVPDRYADGGVLGGIVSGLAASTHPHVLVVAADMPLLNRTLLRALCERAHATVDADGVVPRAPFAATTRNTAGVEPLHAVYRRACLPEMQAALAAGIRRMTDVLARLTVTYVEQDEILRYDPRGLSFVNINTQADLDRLTSTYATALQG
jgi:molybdopterin-guanine dinucleotide biosynthesis protein A